MRKTLHGVLRMLSLRRWAFFVPFTLVSCTAFIMSLYYPRTYRATTSFERRIDPIMMNLPMSAGAASFKYYRNTMMRDLTSLEYMREVVENLGLLKDFERSEDGTLTASSARRRDKLARSLAAPLRVTLRAPTDELDVMTVTYVGPEPLIGKRLVDEVKRTYIRLTMKWIHTYLKDQLDYYTQEAADALEVVKVAQRVETRLYLENPNVDPHNPGALALSLSQLEVERRELLMRQREYQAELSTLRQTLATFAPKSVSQAVSANEGASLPGGAIGAGETLRLAAQVHEVDSEIQRLRSTRGMTDYHPEIQTLIAQREQFMAKYRQHAGPDGVLAVASGPLEMEASTAGEVDSTQKAWAAEHARLLVQIPAQEAKLKDVEINLSTNEVNIKQLKQVKRGIYGKQEEFAAVTGAVTKAQGILSQREEVLGQIKPALKAIQQDRLLKFSEGQPARGSSMPISPRATTVVLLAVLAGLGAGVLFVILSEVLDQVIRSSSQAARSLGLPLLESIDEIVTSQDRRYFFVRRAVIAPAVVICFVGLISLTGSMAFLSIEQPKTYREISRLPRAVIHLFAGTPEAKPSAALPDSDK